MAIVSPNMASVLKRYQLICFKKVTRDILNNTNKTGYNELSECINYLKENKIQAKKDIYKHLKIK